MKNTVIIKGNKYGITIVLDKEIEFSQLSKDLSIKLENAEEFFDSDKQLAVTFQGRELSNEEMDELLHVITTNSKLNIQYVMDHNNDVEATFFDIIQTAKAIDELEQKNIKDIHLDNSNLFDTEDLFLTDVQQEYYNNANGCTTVGREKEHETNSRSIIIYY